MVEDVLKKGNLITVAELKRKLPRQVMHDTVIQVLDYLQISGKIMIGTKGVLWIFTKSKKLVFLLDTFRYLTYNCIYQIEVE